MTTVKGVQTSIDAWCSYHLAIGFEHLFLYFDDPQECAEVDMGSRFTPSSVSAIAHDDILRAAWRRSLEPHDDCLPHAAQPGNRVGSGLNLRQELNARHAMKLACERGLDWLLHIDGDELFYPGPSGDAAAHFGELSAAGTSTFCYVNHEAVPESRRVDRPFSELTLFKSNLDAVPRTDEARAAGGFWTRRLDSSYFIYYDNGKAAARCDAAVRPLSPHEWLPPQASLDRAFTNMTSPAPLRHIRHRNRPAAEELARRVRYRACEACILHYPVHCWETLWRRWQRGNLSPSLWHLFQEQRARRRQRADGGNAPEEMSGCRSSAGVAAQGSMPLLDGAFTSRAACEEEAQAILRHIYEEHVVLEDEAEVRRQVAAGVCRRVLLPKRVLAETAEAREPRARR